MKIVGIGDNVVDRYINNRIMFPGGNAVNFSVYCRQCGEDSAYLGNIANDREGRLIRRSLQEIGVDVSMSPLIDGQATERCDVILKDGDREFQGSSYGEGKWVPLRITDGHLEYLKDFDVIHCGCYSDMEDEISKLADIQALKTYDFSEEKEYREDSYLKKICPYINVALFSGAGMTDEEAEKLQKKVFEMGTDLVLVTNGLKGQELWDGKKFYSGRIKPVKAIDTMGAGDSFFASFIVALMRNMRYEDAFEFAADFSAKNCLIEGAFGFGEKY